MTSDIPKSPESYIPDMNIDGKYIPDDTQHQPVNEDPPDPSIILFNNINKIYENTHFQEPKETPEFSSVWKYIKDWPLQAWPPKIIGNFLNKDGEPKVSIAPGTHHTILKDSETFTYYGFQNFKDLVIVYGPDMAKSAFMNEGINYLNKHPLINHIQINWINVAGEKNTSNFLSDISGIRCHVNFVKQVSSQRLQTLFYHISSDDYQEIIKNQLCHNSVGNKTLPYITTKLYQNMFDLVSDLVIALPITLDPNNPNTVIPNTIPSHDESNNANAVIPDTISTRDKSKSLLTNLPFDLDLD